MRSIIWILALFALASPAQAQEQEQDKMCQHTDALFWSVGQAMEDWRTGSRDSMLVHMSSPRFDGFLEFPKSKLPIGSGFFMTMVNYSPDDDFPDPIAGRFLTLEPEYWGPDGHFHAIRTDELFLHTFPCKK